VIIHFEHIPNQFTSYTRAWLDFPQQVPGSPVFERLRVPLDTGGISISLAIDRCFPILVAQILHPHLGVLLGIEVVIHAHPFVQVSGEDLIKAAGRTSCSASRRASVAPIGMEAAALVVADPDTNDRSHLLSGVNLISLLLGQLEKTIRDAKVADPNSLCVNCAVWVQKTLEPALDKIHSTA